MEGCLRDALSNRLNDIAAVVEQSSNVNMA